MSLGDLDNNHAFGVFNSKTILKNPGKFDYTKLDDSAIISDKFVVGHNRLGTNWSSCSNEEYGMKKEEGIIKEGNPFFTINANTNLSYLDILYYNLLEKGYRKKEGKVLEEKQMEEKEEEIKFNDNINNHPFELGDFIMVHNGIIHNDYELRTRYNIKTEITTDSYVILWLINYFFKKSNLKNRRNKIIEAITKTTKQLHGSYSVILFDKISNDTFYFKSLFTHFTFRYIGKLLVGSTSRNNFREVYKISSKDKKLFSPKSGIIYLISEYPIKRLFVFDNFLKKEEEKKKVKGGKMKDEHNIPRQSRLWVRRRC